MYSRNNQGLFAVICWLYQLLYIFTLCFQSSNAMIAQDTFPNHATMKNCPFLVFLNKTEANF